MKKLPDYNVKISLGYANSKISREFLWKELTGKECLHKDTNENGEML